MLFIKGIYLLLFTFTNLPITVRAVWHTAVSCFYTTRCVASCFQPFLRDTFQLLPFNWQVCPSWSVIDYSTTMAFADFSRQALLRFFRKNNYLMRPWDLLGYEQYLSTLYLLYFIAKLKGTPPTIPNSYRTLICHAILSTVISLYEVSVCWVRYLPPASFRFHLTMNTLALGYVIPAIRACSGLSPVR